MADNKRSVAVPWLGVAVAVLLAGIGNLSNALELLSTHPESPAPLTVILTTARLLTSCVMILIGSLGSVLVVARGTNWRLPADPLAIWLAVARNRVALGALIGIVLLFLGVLTVRAKLSDTPIHDIAFAQHVLYVDNTGQLRDLVGDATGKGDPAWQDTSVSATFPNEEAPSSPSVVAFESNGVHYVAYISGRRHVIEAVESATGWIPEDLTSIAQAPTPSSDSTLAVYASSNEQNLFYMDQEGNVEDLHWDRTDWTGLNLSPTLPAFATAGPNRSLTVYAINDRLNVAYVGADHHVVDLSRTDSDWQAVDVTANASDASPAPDSRLTSYVFGNTENIVYTTTDGHVHELVGVARAWHALDLTLAVRISPAIKNSPLTAYVWEANPRISYVSSDGDVVELWGEGKSWYPLDYSYKARSPRASAGGLSVFALDGFEHVVYAGSNGRIYDLTHVTGDDDRWAVSDLLQRSGAPEAMVGTDVADLVVSDTQVAFYVGSDLRIHELMWSWSFGPLRTDQELDITKIARAATVRSHSKLVSSRLANQQHLFYVASDGDFHELRLTLSADRSLAWRDQDISSGNLLPAPPTADGPMVGYLQGVSQHIVYEDEMGHLDELSAEWSGDDWKVWRVNDLTQRTGSPVVSRDSLISAYMLGDTAHVVATTSSRHVVDLSYQWQGSTPSSWMAADVTAVTGAPSGSGLTTCVIAGAQYLEYSDDAGRILEVAQSPVLATAADRPNSWKLMGNATGTDGTPGVRSRRNLSSDCRGSAPALIYVDADGHVRQISLDGTGWHSTDLSFAAGSPRAVGVDAAFEALHGAEYVLYRDIRGQLYELRGNHGGWQVENLTTIEGALRTVTWSNVVNASSSVS